MGVCWSSPRDLPVGNTIERGSRRTRSLVEQENEDAGHDERAGHDQEHPARGDSRAQREPDQQWADDAADSPDAEGPADAAAGPMSIAAAMPPIVVSAVAPTAVEAVWPGLPRTVGSQL
ncbi:hypothetical protein [Amycolatopsis sp.]|uniref:hypothetical protein n=1 Tax=Amycolatopsis sp. TaxID=37632 RepID=UPI002E06BD32|nr:hypothetical protein [Amycolatopsis sp.]